MASVLNFRLRIQSDGKCSGGGPFVTPLRWDISSWHLLSLLLWCGSVFLYEKDAQFGSSSITILMVLGCRCRNQCAMYVTAFVDYTHQLF